MGCRRGMIKTASPAVEARRLRGTSAEDVSGREGVSSWFMPGARKSRQPSLWTSFARWMRAHPTRSEALLFGQLRKRKLGVRFRQQHVFALGYIVDLYAPCAKLVVEVDGGVHRKPEQARLDAQRQRELEAVYGVRIVAVTAELVERDPHAAADIVRAALSLAR